MWLSFTSIRGLSVTARDEEAGRLVDVLVDDERWEVTFFVVRAGSWFLSRNLLIEPETLASIDLDRGLLELQLSRAQLEESEQLIDAPPVSLQRRKARDRAAGWVPIWPMAKISGSPEARSAGIPRPPLGDPHLRSLDELLGYGLSTMDGKAGRVDDVLIESGTLAARYLVTRLGSWLSSRQTLVSTSWLTEVSWKHQRLLADLDALALEEGPTFEGLGGFDRPAQERLHQHYGRPLP